MPAVTKTLGKAGTPTRDFSSVDEVMDYFAGGGNDITASGTNEDFTLEVYNDDGTSFDYFIGDAGFQLIPTTDSTHQIRIVAAAGHSWRDVVDPATDPVRYDPANGVAFENTSHRGSSISHASQGYVTIRGLQTKSGWYGIGLYQGTMVAPCLVEDCLSVCTNWQGSGVSVSGAGSIARNNYVMPEGGSGGSLFEATFDAECYNNTGMVDGTARGTGVFAGGAGFGIGAALKVQNNAVFGVTTAIEPMTVSGVTTVTNNASNATFDSMFNGTNVGGLTATDQFDNPTATGGWDLALKAGNDLVGAGVSVSAVTDDAFGTARPNPPTIGAQEWAAAPPSSFANPFGLLGVGRAA